MKLMGGVIATFILLAGIVVGGCQQQKVNSAGQPIPIILLADKYTKPNIPRRYVMLKIEYGMIITNTGADIKIPEYYLFCRDQKRIVKTTNADEFISELEKIPDGSRIDIISKCSVPFYINTDESVDISDQYRKIMDVLARKKCVLIESLDDDPNHIFFCYCETGYTILDRYDPSVAKECEGK